MEPFAAKNQREVAGLHMHLTESFDELVFNREVPQSMSTESMANKPIEISLPEWKEIMQVPEIKESWGLQDHETPEQFADMVYGVKFHFSSGGPGYVGDLYVLHGDALGEPMTLIRTDGRLTLA